MADQLVRGLRLAQGSLVTWLRFGLRRATGSVLCDLRPAITERRAGDGRTVPARHWATLRQVLFDMPRTMSDLSPQ